MGMLPHVVLQGESVRVGMTCNNNVSMRSLKMVNGDDKSCICMVRN